MLQYTPKTLSSAAVEMEKNDVKSVHCTLGEKKRFHFGMRWKLRETTDITIPRGFQQLQVSIFWKPLFSLSDISMIFATPTSTRY